LPVRSTRTGKTLAEEEREDSTAFGIRVFHVAGKRPKSLANLPSVLRAN
jgi:hypothetical protein